MLLLLTLCFPSFESSAQGKGTASMVSGRVLDTKGKPVEYAGVYFKGRPDAGTVTDKLGYFSLEGTSMDDTLVVAMMGYSTFYRPASKLGKSVNVKLKEQPVRIDASVVESKRSGSRSRRNKEIREVLQNVYLRLAGVDYACARSHTIASDIAIYSEDSLIMRNRLTGLLYQAPFIAPEDGKMGVASSTAGSSSGKKSVSDTLWIRMDSYQSFLQDDIRSGLAELEESDMKMTKDEKKLLNAFGSPERNKTLPHRVLWRMDVMAVFSNIYEDGPSHWAISERSDTSFCLTYYRRYDILGIAKADVLIEFDVNAADFSIKRMSWDSKAYLNLLFSYKFTPAELTVLNLVCVDEEQLSQYRLKKAEFTTKGQILLKSIGGVMVPVDKSIRNTILAIDNKKVPYFFCNDCTQIVLQ